jgi:hypothetical protein
VKTNEIHSRISVHCGGDDDCVTQRKVYNVWKDSKEEGGTLTMNALGSDWL